jgi:tetratricopeptide (TPR) repeat protein
MGASASHRGCDRWVPRDVGIRLGGDAAPASKRARGTPEREPHPPYWSPGLLALILDAKGDERAAIDEAQVSVRIAPTNPAPNFYLARILYDAGRYEQAVETLRSVMQIDAHGSPRYVCVLAAAYDHLGEPEKAIPLLETAAQSWPDDVEIHTWLVLSFGLTNRMVDAKNEMVVVHRLAPMLRLATAGKDVTLGKDPQFRERAIRIEQAAGLPP